MYKCGCLFVRVNYFCASFETLICDIIFIDAACFPVGTGQREPSEN
jgi:hypothetical protein